MLEGRTAKLADLLFDEAAIKFGAFTLKLHESTPDAPLSPIYINLRTADNPKPGSLTPPTLDLAATLMLEQVRRDVPEMCIRHISGIPNAGDPFADAAARAGGGSAGITVLHLGKEEHNGRRRITNGRQTGIPGGTEVLIIDDMITQADSKFEAIRAVEAAGLRVRDIAVLVDRQQGGPEQLAAAGYRLHTVYRLDELLAHYVATRRVERPKADEVLAHVATQGAGGAGTP